LARRLIRVKHIAMPNLLANETIYPEFIQSAATPENLARAALDLLNNRERRALMQTKLAAVIASLGPPGASQRAARAVAALSDGTVSNRQLPAPGRPPG
jgi:lipid-A-disaccharide synthase